MDSSYTARDPNPPHGIKILSGIAVLSMFSEEKPPYSSLLTLSREKMID